LFVDIHLKKLDLQVHSTDNEDDLGEAFGEGEVSLEDLGHQIISCITIIMSKIILVIIELPSRQQLLI